MQQTLDRSANAKAQIALRIQEAALTGDSESIEKETAAIDRPEVPLGDRKNMGFMGTMVTYGRGTAVVVATGSAR